MKTFGNFEIEGGLNVTGSTVITGDRADSAANTLALLNSGGTSNFSIQDGGNAFFGSNSGFTFDSANERIGIGLSGATLVSKLQITGNTLNLIRMSDAAGEMMTIHSIGGREIQFGQIFDGTPANRKGPISMLLPDGGHASLRIISAGGSISQQTLLTYNTADIGAALIRTRGGQTTSSALRVQSKLNTSSTHVERLRIGSNQDNAIFQISQSHLSMNGSNSFSNFSVRTNGDFDHLEGNSAIGLHSLWGASTFNNTTAVSGTTSSNNFIAHKWEVPTLTSTSGFTGAEVNYAEASTLYIDGAPLSTTSTTIDNAYALFIADGTTRLDGDLLIERSDFTTPINASTQVDSNRLEFKTHIWSGTTDAIRTHTLYGAGSIIPLQNDTSSLVIDYEGHRFVNFERDEKVEIFANLTASSAKVFGVGSDDGAGNYREKFAVSAAGEAVITNTTTFRNTNTSGTIVNTFTWGGASFFNRPGAGISFVAGANNIDGAFTIHKDNQRVGVGVGLIGGAAAAVVDAKLEVRGEDYTTSATTLAFKVTDSGDTAYFQLRDDKRLIYTDGNEAVGKVLTSDGSGVATWTSAGGFTGNTSGDCISDIHVSNIHSCSPLHINPFDEGSVVFGASSAMTIDLANNRIGINVTGNPTSNLHISGSSNVNTMLVEDTQGHKMSVGRVSGEIGFGIIDTYPAPRPVVRIDNADTSSPTLYVRGSNSFESWISAVSASLNKLTLTQRAGDLATTNIHRFQTLNSSNANVIRQSFTGGADIGVVSFPTAKIAIGYIGNNTNTPSNFRIAQDLTENAWGVNGIGFYSLGNTYTDDSTAADATVANAAINSFAAATLESINSGVTTTDAATVYIAGAPIAGTGQTITNAYSLWIEGGDIRYQDGNEAVGKVLTSDGSGVATWTSAGGFTGNTSGDCISDIHVSNIHSCSPLHINPFDEGSVVFGASSAMTIDLTGATTLSSGISNGSSDTIFALNSNNLVSTVEKLKIDGVGRMTLTSNVTMRNGSTGGGAVGHWEGNAGDVTIFGAGAGRAVVLEAGGGGYGLVMRADNQNVGIGTGAIANIANPVDARLEIRGSGNTDSTLSFKVTNSADTETFIITDGGKVGINLSGSPTNHLQILDTGDTNTMLIEGSGGQMFSINRAAVATGEIGFGKVDTHPAPRPVVRIEGANAASPLFYVRYANGWETKIGGESAIMPRTAFRMVSGSPIRTNAYTFGTIRANGNSLNRLSFSSGEDITGIAITSSYLSMGVGAADPDNDRAVIHISQSGVFGATSGLNWGDKGVGLRIDSDTYVDLDTASGATVANAHIHAIAKPIFSSTSGATGGEVTATNAATLYIAGAPVETINKTIITNAYSLQIATGDTKLDNLIIGDTANTATIKIVDGNQAAGSVLTSDADGNATWSSAVDGDVNKFVITTGFTGSIAKNITHGLGTEDIDVSIWETSPKKLTAGEVIIIDSNNITVEMSVTASFKVVVMG